MINDDDDHLTVYSKIEERSVSGGTRTLLPNMCCNFDNPKETNDSESTHCYFKRDCSDSLKHLHRRLILGEPVESLDKVPFTEAHVFNDWSPDAIARMLVTATNLIEAITEKSINEGKLASEDSDLCTAIILIRIFTQLNFTGPDICTDELKSFETVCSQTEINDVIKTYLEVEGIEVQAGMRCPSLLLLANYFLSSTRHDSTLWPFYLIWSFRIDFLRQRILTRRSWILSRNLKYCADKYIAWASHHDMNGVLAEVHGTFLCEISEMLVYYYDGLLSERFLEAAMKTLGITVELSGKMGFRTKFQQTPMPQTVVNVNVSPSYVSSISPDQDNTYLNSIPKSLPNSEALNDDTRLDRIRLVDDQTVQPHAGAHQLVLCGAMLHKQGFCGNTDLDRQEIEALINVIIDNPVSWSGRICALLARCKLEKFDKRAIDRTLRQLEELLKFIPRQGKDWIAPQRQFLFFGSGHPSRSDVKLLFGEVLLTLEHWKEALNIYTELDSFEQIVVCYERMNLRHKAEELVREKIEKEGKSSKLLILLGDVTNDISFYEEAWTLSQMKSYFSQSRLGEYYFKRGEFEKAGIYLKRAVDLAPLEYPSWIKLAWASYKTEDYETAFQAYLRAANLEYDNFQVWNNLANCALKLDRKDYALRAYKLAVKCNYDEWRVWSNILVVASELKIIPDALNAYHRILDMNKTFSDESILDVLVTTTISNEHPDFTNMSNLTKLFGRITSMGSRSFMVWLLYGRLLAAYLHCDNTDCTVEVKTSNYERGMNYYDKSLTIIRQNPNWKSDLHVLKNVVSGIAEFRQKREEGLSKLPMEVNSRLNGMDAILKQTALSVYDNLKKLTESLPNPEKLIPIFNEMVEEIKSSFYS